MSTNITINDCCTPTCNLKYYAPGFNGGDYTPVLLKEGPTVLYTLSFAGSDTQVEIYDANTTAGLHPDNSDTNYLLAWGGGTGHWSFENGLPLTMGLVVKMPVSNTAGDWSVITYK
jgi:hypothetical protein